MYNIYALLESTIRCSHRSCATTMTYEYRGTNGCTSTEHVASSLRAGFVRWMQLGSPQSFAKGTTAAQPSELIR